VSSKRSPPVEGSAQSMTPIAVGIRAIISRKASAPARVATRVKRESRSNRSDKAESSSGLLSARATLIGAAWAFGNSIQADLSHLEGWDDSAEQLAKQSERVAI